MVSNVELLNNLLQSFGETQQKTFFRPEENVLISEMKSLYTWSEKNKMNLNKNLG